MPARAATKAEPRSPGRLTSRSILVIGLIALRVLLIVAAIRTIPADGRTALGNDARRFLEIARSPGVPYRDFAVEVPPLSVGAIRVLAWGAADPRALAERLAWLMFGCDLAAAAMLARGWGRDVATEYLVLGTSVAFFIYFRLDLLSVLFAVAGVTLARRRRPELGAVSLVAGAFTKIWPIFLVPAAAVLRRSRSVWIALGTAIGGGVAWILAFGPNGPWQVLTFRGASGWGIESTIGLPLWAFTKMPVRLESGAYRIGTAPASVRAFLAAAMLAVITWVWLHATERTADGAAPVAVLAAVLLLSPHTSLQWIVWLLPWVAISQDAALRGGSIVAGLAATGVYLGASSGESTAAIALVLEFVRVIAVGGLFLVSIGGLRSHATESERGRSSLDGGRRPPGSA